VAEGKYKNFKREKQEQNGSLEEEATTGANAVVIIAKNSF
jgi:hypothetical protein